MAWFAIKSIAACARKIRARGLKCQYLRVRQRAVAPGAFYRPGPAIREAHQPDHGWPDCTPAPSCRYPLIDSTTVERALRQVRRVTRRAGGFAHGGTARSNENQGRESNVCKLDHEILLLIPGLKEYGLAGNHDGEFGITVPNGMQKVWEKRPRQMRNNARTLFLCNCK